MTLFTDVLIQVTAYITVMVVTFAIFNFLSKGYLRNYLIVKASRGRKILVRVITYTGIYYKPGKIDSGVLQYKNIPTKDKDTYKIERDSLIQEMGINLITIDETTKKVIKPSTETTEGHDTTKFDYLLQRALYKPSFKDNPKEMIIIALCVISCILSGFVIYLLMSMGQKTVAGAGGIV